MPSLLLGGLVVALSVGATGCGERVEPPIGRATETPTTATVPAEDPAPEVVGLVSFSAIGDVPEVTDEPSRVDTAGGRAAYVEAFAERTRGALEEALDRAQRPGRVGAGSVLTATLVALGCDEPGGVGVERAGEGWRVEPDPAPQRSVECLVPVATVALVTLPAPGS